MVNYNLDAMRQGASSLESLLSEWSGQCDKLYAIHGEIDAMWDGNANDAFNSKFLDEDKPKYDKLYNEINSYLEALKTAITKYEEMEENIKAKF